jgi:hypothetical protein
MKSFLYGLPLAAVILASGTAAAQLLDDIEVVTAQGFAEARLKFSTPVRYIRHFPPEHGEIVNIYLQMINPGEFDEPTRQEYKKSPAVGGVPTFTVTYTTEPACQTMRDPVCMVIQFQRPVNYKIRPGGDNRTLLLYIPLPSAEDRPAAPGK